MVRTIAACLIDVAGDVNENGSLTAADIIAMVGYVFKSGPPPEPCDANGDVNCDGAVSTLDIDPFVTCLTTGDCDCP